MTSKEEVKAKPKAKAQAKAPAKEKAKVAAKEQVKAPAKEKAKVAAKDQVKTSAKEQVKTPAKEQTKAPKQQGPKLLIRQVGSPLRRNSKQALYLKSLGLGKMNRERTLMDTPGVRGLLKKVHHLVAVID